VIKYGAKRALSKYVRLVFVYCVVIITPGCQEDGPRYISIHHLRIEHEKFIGREIIIKGYLSGMLAENLQPAYLYATSDDANMRNRSAAVFIDVYNNPRLIDISDCMERFVEVKGTFGETNNPHLKGLGMTEIRHLRIVPHSPDRGMEAYCVRPEPIEDSPQ